MPYVHYTYTNWSKEKIFDQLATDAAWVERALVVLYQRQVKVEQDVAATVFDNEVGFQPADARWFTRFAVRVQKQAVAGVPPGQRLTPAMLKYARRPWTTPRAKRIIPAICKYRGQILEIIEKTAKDNGAPLKAWKAAR